MPHGKRVEWDEENLEANAEYQRLHPVTLHITEPKTPYVHVDDDVEEAEPGEGSWDPTVNSNVRKMKEDVITDTSDRPKAPIGKNGRPMLAAGTADGTLEAEQRNRDFKKMRKAVYADEGAVFKKALQQNMEDE